MMTSYFSCLQECTELLIDIFSFGGISQKSLSEMAMTNRL